MEQFQSLLPSGKQVTCLEDLSSLRVSDLKKILSVYKEKLSGVKADLVLRVYAVFSRISRTIDTPVIEEIVVGECPSTYGFIKCQCLNVPWTSDLKNTPPFTFIQLYEYLVIRTVKYKHILLKSSQYKRLKAFQFFQEGFIKKIEVAFTDNHCYFDVRMKASMRSKLYKVIVKLCSTTGDVMSAACTCPAGVGIHGFGNCNHVGGVLFGLEDLNRRGLKDLPSSSCTSKLSSWNVPRDCSSNPVPIEEVVIKKIKFGSKSSTSEPKINLYDPRAECDRNVNTKQLNLLKQNLSENLGESCFFLFHGMNPYPPCGVIQDITQEVISMDIENDVTLSGLSVSDSNHNVLPECSFSDCYNISRSEFKNMMDTYASSLSISSDTIYDIEKSTRGQSSSAEWFDQRKYKITASNFYAACRNTVEPSSKLKSMFYTSFTTSATNHGKLYEEHVLQLYKSFLQSKNVDVSLETVGLLLSESHPYLGASLDGIVVDCHSGEKWGIEIKCPFSKFNMTMEDALKDKKFFLEKKDSRPTLKESHKYFYQVQGQLFCSNLDRVDFVVWLGDHEPLHIESIFFNEIFWSSKVLPGLSFSHRRAVLAEYFTRRVAEGKKLYLHGGWTNEEK